MKQFGPIVGWRNYKQTHALCGCVCVACKKKYYPKKYLCSCGSIEFEKKRFLGKGMLLTFTSIGSRCLGLVMLEEGVKILAQITDVKLCDLYIGMPVRAVFRLLSEDGPEGIIHYGIKFVPIQKA
ncbi:OB-fold domain-containing protein [Candidatus Dependentiae bacterium]|nr:OB-fold domain-containing protein [Candidatus Dependentiae bacterium]